MTSDLSSALEVCIQTRRTIQIDVYFTLLYFRCDKLNYSLLDRPNTCDGPTVDVPWRNFSVRIWNIIPEGCILILVMPEFRFRSSTV